jgi:hypothetical protein
VALIEKFCLESLKKRRVVGRTRHRQQDNIKMDLKGRGRVEGGTVLYRVCVKVETTFLGSIYMPL